MQYFASVSTQTQLPFCYTLTSSGMTEGGNSKLNFPKLKSSLHPLFHKLLINIAAILINHVRHTEHSRSLMACSYTLITVTYDIQIALLNKFFTCSFTLPTY